MGGEVGQVQSYNYIIIRGVPSKLVGAFIVFPS